MWTHTFVKLLFHILCGRNHVATQLFISLVSSSQYFEFHLTFYLCLVTVMSYFVQSHFTTLYVFITFSFRYTGNPGKLAGLQVADLGWVEC